MHDPLVQLTSGAWRQARHGIPDMASVKQSHHKSKKQDPYLVGTSKAAKDGTPGLAGLIPGSDGIPGHRANRGVGNIEVEDAWGCLLEELATAVP